ncbi:hypothetical protein [Glutamicibacter soli]
MQQQEGSGKASHAKQARASTIHEIIFIAPTMSTASTPRNLGFLGNARTDHPRMFHFFSLPDFPG